MKLNLKDKSKALVQVRDILYLQSEGFLSDINITGMEPNTFVEVNDVETINEHDEIIDFATFLRLGARDFRRMLEDSEQLRCISKTKKYDKYYKYLENSAIFYLCMKERCMLSFDIPLTPSSDYYNTDGVYETVSTDIEDVYLTRRIDDKQIDIYQRDFLRFYQRDLANLTNNETDKYRLKGIGNKGFTHTYQTVAEKTLVKGKMKKKARN